jgi:hypothetical protein
MLHHIFVAGWFFYINVLARGMRRKMSADGLNKFRGNDWSPRSRFERFDRYYGYKSLFEFTKKFHPMWRGRHVAYRSVAQLVPAAATIVRVHLPNALFKDIRS